MFIVFIRLGQPIRYCDGTVPLSELRCQQLHMLRTALMFIVFIKMPSMLRYALQIMSFPAAGFMRSAAVLAATATCRGLH